MGVFRPVQHECELNFDDRFIYRLPLHEDTADRIDRAVSKIKNIAPKDRKDIDSAYNEALDIIDELLGDGSADNIMSLYDNPGTLEVFNVLYYIFDEWKTAFAGEVEKMKSTAQLPSRTERRAKR